MPASSSPVAEMEQYRPAVTRFIRHLVGMQPRLKTSLKRHSCVPTVR